MDLESDNALLATKLKHTKRASTETIVTIVEEIELSDDKVEELKKEVRCS